MTIKFTCSLLVVFVIFLFLLFVFIFNRGDVDYGAERLFNSGSDLFSGDISSVDVLVIGEVHGTRQSPQLLGDMARHMPGKVLIALELFSDSERLPCDEGMRLPNSWVNNAQFGTNSFAMRELVCQIRNDPRYGSTLFLSFYLGDRIDLSTYDQEAAVNVAEAMQRYDVDRAIVLTGNLHARNGPQTLTAQMRAMGLSVISAVQSSQNASAWFCSGISPSELSCGPQAARMSYCSPNADQSTVAWTLSTSPAYDRCIHMPELRPSSPAVGLAF